MEKSCIIINEEGVNNPRKLLRDLTAFYKEQRMPVFIASYDNVKQSPIMETILPAEVGNDDVELNINFDKFMKEYMYLRIAEKKKDTAKKESADADADDIDE